MAAGESQTWSSEVSGWLSRSILVRFLYSFSALLMTCWKLVEEAAVEEE